jgi:hypothetical protein
MNAAITEELERAYRYLNTHLFGGKLKSISFSVQIKKKISLRWIKSSKSIVLGSEFSKLEPSDIPHLLLHEMIHIANDQQDISDITVNQYHNKYFLALALQVGLVVIKHKTQGWSITTTFYPRNVVQKDFVKKPSKEAFLRRINTFNSLKFDSSIFRGVRKQINQMIKLEKPVKVYFLKYQCNCPPPHNSIRSGRRPDGPNALNIMCMNCRSNFQCVSDTESNELE